MVISSDAPRHGEEDAVMASDDDSTIVGVPVPLTDVMDIASSPPPSHKLSSLESSLSPPPSEMDLDRDFPMPPVRGSSGRGGLPPSAPRATPVPAPAQGPDGGNEAEEELEGWWSIPRVPVAPRVPVHAPPGYMSDEDEEDEVPRSSPPPRSAAASPRSSAVGSSDLETLQQELGAMGKKVEMPLQDLLHQILFAAGSEDAQRAFQAIHTLP